MYVYMYIGPFQNTRKTRENEFCSWNLVCKLLSITSNYCMLEKKFWHFSIFRNWFLCFFSRFSLIFIDFLWKSSKNFKTLEKLGKISSGAEIWWVSSWVQPPTAARWRKYSAGGISIFRNFTDFHWFSLIFNENQPKNIIPA